jgi:hypothetical protein
MADETSVSPHHVEVIPSVAGGTSAIASAHAPILFFDETTFFGAYNGIVHAALVAMRFHAAPSGGVTTDKVTVAHLRMNLLAAQGLHAALGQAIALALNPTTDPQHGQLN